MPLPSLLPPSAADFFQPTNALGQSFGRGLGDDADEEVGDRRAAELVAPRTPHSTPSDIRMIPDTTEPQYRRQSRLPRKGRVLHHSPGMSVNEVQILPDPEQHEVLVATLERVNRVSNAARAAALARTG